jgi:hypothetical protein
MEESRSNVRCCEKEGDLPSIAGPIHSYIGPMDNPHHRYRSWHYCYGYFQHDNDRQEIARDPDSAALQLATYLASWGMYRGSGFLLNYAYTVHTGVIERLIAPEFDLLWEREFGAVVDDPDLIPVILDAVAAIREAYAPFAAGAMRLAASDTLVTKVLLGMIGCVPACDEYFKLGFAQCYPYSDVNRLFLQRVHRFCRCNLEAIETERQHIFETLGVLYPLMKLVDMYFWKVGFSAAEDRKASSAI